MDLTKRLTMTVDMLSSLPGHHELLSTDRAPYDHGDWLHYDVCALHRFIPPVFCQPLVV